VQDGTRRALVAASALVMLAALSGCKTVISASGGSSGGSPTSAATGSAATGSAAAGSPAGALAKISDEGKVTFSVQLSSCHASDGGQLPDPHCTPGSVDPAITQADIATTICRSGYTATVRPPASETNKAKFDVAYPAYGIPTSDRSELDHLVSLELGGSNDITNLWPEVGTVPNPKDKVENALHKAVCEGKVTLTAAQRAIAADWQTAESSLGLSG
jgi:hypothetical protein